MTLATYHGTELPPLRALDDPSASEDGHRAACHVAERFVEITAEEVLSR